MQRSKRLGAALASCVLAAACATEVTTEDVAHTEQALEDYGAHQLVVDYMVGGGASEPIEGACNIELECHPDGHWSFLDRRCDCEFLYDDLGPLIGIPQPYDFSPASVPQAFLSSCPSPGLITRLTLPCMENPYDVTGRPLPQLPGKPGVGTTYEARSLEVWDSHAPDPFEEGDPVPGGEKEYGVDDRIDQDRVQKDYTTVINEGVGTYYLYYTSPQFPGWAFYVQKVDVENDFEVPNQPISPPLFYEVKNRPQF